MSLPRQDRQTLRLAYKNGAKLFEATGVNAAGAFHDGMAVPAFRHQNQI